MALKEEATIEEEVDVVVAVTTGMNKAATTLMIVKGMVVEAMRLVAEVVDVVDKEDMQNHKFRAIFVRDLCMTSMTLVFLMSYNETEPPQSVTWFLDSGASNPMEGRKEFFARLDEGQQGKQDQIW
ncbi:hypothetical protein SDJN03_18693, partial [Cucurbita argyrosperma subsp. sororia]